MTEHTGWLLDIYPDPQGGLAVWLLADDGARLRLRQDFPVTFYAAGPAPRLRALWRFLHSQPEAPRLSRQERRDLFQDGLVPVLAVQTPQPIQQPGLFARARRAFPDLTYYDADLPAALRHAARYGTFPLGRCRAACDAAGIVGEIEALDSPWEVDPEPAPLRILSIDADCDPRRSQPQALLLRYGRASCRLALEPARPLLVNLAAVLRSYDPDLILAGRGDSWLLPYLLRLAGRLGVPLPLNRHPEMGQARRPERTYYAYGQVIYRGPQVMLFGRWHIDVLNAVMFHDYGLQGVLEQARVTSLPVQTAARVSPGTGISAMQIRTALQQGVLVPWHKQQAEQPKSVLELLRADQGGLVYQPITGLHRDVAEVDFISMYPSIMVHFNISPETVDPARPGARRIPELGLEIDQEQPGLIPETLRPLLEKRIALKTRLQSMPAWDPRRRLYQEQAAAHKWLLVTCFGYLGYKNARFGRIEAHEAVTAYGRELLLRAKEAAEDLGFTVLHLYVDGLWVQRPGSRAAADFQPLLDEIARRTGLPIALDGVYRWVAFLPSRVNPAVPVANRYFGLFQDGSFKLRGIEARRRDTPPFLAQMQQEILALLAQAGSAEELPGRLPAVTDLLQRRLAELRAGRIPLEKLVVTQRLSRELGEYRAPSPVARAARQLQAAGKAVRPGMYVPLLFLRGAPGVHAWEQSGLPPASALDVDYYSRLLLRAASTLLGPLGVSQARLRDWLFSNAAYGAPPGRLPAQGALVGLTGEAVLRGGRAVGPAADAPGLGPYLGAEVAGIGRYDAGGA
jgi:DNA polymerase-2